MRPLWLPRTTPPIIHDLAPASAYEPRFPTPCHSACYSAARPFFDAMTILIFAPVRLGFAMGIAKLHDLAGRCSARSVCRISREQDAAVH